MFGIHRATLDGRRHFDVVPFTAGDFLGVRIAAVGQHLELLDLQHPLRPHRHRVQEMAVVGVIIDVVVDNQATRDIDDALEVI